jgi:hypothetical protein
LLVTPSLGSQRDRVGVILEVDDRIPVVVATELEAVAAASAVEPIAAGLAAEEVIAVPAGEHVIAVPAGEHVAPVPALNAVIAVPAVERVEAVLAEERVAAAPAEELVVAIEPPQLIAQVGRRITILRPAPDDVVQICSREGIPALGAIDDGHWLTPAGQVGCFAASLTRATGALQCCIADKVAKRTEGWVPYGGLREFRQRF